MDIDLKLLTIKKLTGYSFASDIKLNADGWTVDGVSFITLSQVRREAFLEELKELIRSWDNKLDMSYAEVDNGVYECLVFEKKVKSIDKTSAIANTFDVESMITEMLVKKDLDNIQQGKRKEHMLDWLKTTTYVDEKNTYTPPFYKEDYLKWLEQANIWAVIPEYPAYEINSTTADVREISTKMLVPKTTSSQGKIYYELCNKQRYGDTKKMKSRAYLLAITFMPNPDVSIYNQVHYVKDRNVDKLTNLVWSNQSEATKKNFAKGRKKAKQLTDKEKEEIAELVFSGAPYSYGKLSRKYGVHSFVMSSYIKNLIENKKEQLEQVI